MSQHRPVVLALALGAACGGSDEVAVTVQMSLDPATCVVTEPASVQLDCDTTAGVWLRGEAGEILDQACVDFTGELPTLADLPSLLAGVDLSTASSGDMWVDVAVYAPWHAADGCLAPDDLPEGGGLPQIIVRGSSGSVTSSGQNGSVQVLLDCDSIGPPIDTGQCDQMCSSDLEACFNGDRPIQCENELTVCLDGCTDQACDVECEDTFNGCLAATPEGVCELDFETCTDDCLEGDEQCVAACDQDYEGCVDQACSGAYDECTSGCPGGDECASLV